MSFFFYQDFLSQTLTIHSTARQGSRPSFIPLYHFHRLMNIETFCNFACKMAITYFYLQHLCLPDCYSMRCSSLKNLLHLALLVLKLYPIQVISLPLWIKLTMGQLLLLFLSNFCYFF